ncbi:NAD(P)-dependent oxidoreductase [Bordetella genomosp. 13]|uniref:2-hydroxy-3-oxopropionate reductase n=1 Tax=Bordetella genomosp. 13 TaxID=463040 RepID=A0A1W6Z6J8_9BORD|nr:NAD(P)-dependent oxidoreductase [Bordetella genomosp. 13]ARP92979.1 hypothetical protein CAL15_00450 [Bordetella genomosp. 13]
MTASHAPTGAVPVGFVGLGDMGRPMALRLLRAGLPMVVCDRNPAALQPFVAGGAQAASTPREVADLAELVVICLPAPEISLAVALGEDGLRQGARMRWMMETSTVGQSTLHALADGLRPRGIEVLDAPVSGGPRGEAAGRLSCFVSASQAAFDAARPVLSVLADRLFHIGTQPGQSQVLKLANNMLNAANLTLACEMMHMVRSAGIELKTALEVINASTGRSRATEETLPAQVLSGAFDTGARLDILHKDVRLAVAEAARQHTACPAATAAAAVWDRAMAAGLGAADLSRIYEFIANDTQAAKAD